MKIGLIGLCVLVVAASSLTLVVSGATYAADKPHKKMTLAEKGEQARQESIELEQTQLQKAREAAKATSEREQKVLAKQQPNDWEAQQHEKAQAQFDERATREQKYLQQAQDAAKQTRKIPKATTTAEPVLSE
jgi:preprotein translocase subunit SecF